MLDERLEKYSEISDLEGMRFLCQNLALGIHSKNSLSNLRLHHIGGISINLDAALILLAVLKQEYPDLISELLSTCGESSLADFKAKFSNILINYLVSNNVIDLEMLKYDEQANAFYIKQNGFKLNHACYRNLLMSFGVIASRKGGGYFYYGDTTSLAKGVVKKRHTITLAQLEKTLILQREEGELGEQFVLKYELLRLYVHSQKDKIRQISPIDVTAGYDIVSFMDEQSLKLDRFIEVKTFHGIPHFFWSANERRVASIKRDAYFLYLVNVDSIDKSAYEPIVIQNPIDFFQDNIDWKSSIDTLYIEKL